MGLRHPFQKLCFAKASTGLPEVLLAACGAHLCCYDFQKGLVARWPVSEDNEDDLSDYEAEQPNGNDDGERPTKRQRLSGHEESLPSRHESEESVEIISERAKGQRRKPKPTVEPKLPDVSHILATESGRHIVVVTADDKCIRVLERRKDGRLRSISERCMPKRLCAIALTKDGKTIVAGDKFGDVYSLPLFPPDDVSQPAPISNQQDPEPDFKPSASKLTVHTKGNLEALRQQQQQKNLKPKKDGPNFEHHLLLGHVSLLTDLIVAEVEGDHGRRQYILTADRDEHIRVSRGITQAHVINNYCLGHRDFVSKLCIPPWQPKTLIAGSGEPSLRVYDWQRGLCSTDLLASGVVIDEVATHFKVSEQERSIDLLAVSGIWTLSISESQGYILVAFEGVPLVLSFFSDGRAYTQARSLELPGNVLDIAVLELDAKKMIIVSIDTIHKEYSMKSQRETPLDQHKSILCFELVQESHALAKSGDASQKQQLGERSLWKASNYVQAIEEALMKEPVAAATDSDEDQKLGECLYGLENMRKKRGKEGKEADEEM